MNPFNRLVRNAGLYALHHHLAVPYYVLMDRDAAAWAESLAKAIEHAMFNPARRHAKELLAARDEFCEHILKIVPGL